MGQMGQDTLSPFESFKHCSSSTTTIFTISLVVTKTTIMTDPDIEAQLLRMQRESGAQDTNPEGQHSCKLGVYYSLYIRRNLIDLT